MATTNYDLSAMTTRLAEAGDAAMADLVVRQRMAIAGRQARRTGTERSRSMADWPRLAQFRGLRAEARRSDEWGYDLNRHIALIAAVTSPRDGDAFWH